MYIEKDLANNYKEEMQEDTPGKCLHSEKYYTFL